MTSNGESSQNASRPDIRHDGSQRGSQRPSRPEIRNDGSQRGSQRPSRPHTGRFMHTSSTLRPRVTRFPTAETAGTTGTARTAETAGTAGTAGSNKYYSLAGSRDQFRPGDRKTYVSKDYRKMNPNYEQEQSKPVFSLGGNLPRTVRGWQGGKDRDSNRRPAGIETDEKGERDIAPQVENAEERANESEPEPKKQQRPQGERGMTMQSVHVRDEDGQDQVIGDGPVFSPNSSEDEKTLAPEDPPEEEEEQQPQPFNRWTLIRSKFQDPLGEWLGTTIFTALGISCNLAVATSQQQSGQYMSLYFGWGWASMLGIYISGGSSGGHLNPAISIMLSAYRGFPARKLPTFIFFQVLGAFVGAVIAIAIYRDAILQTDGALLPASTGIEIYTQPKQWVKPATAFFTEFLGTAIFSCAILALGDDSNSPPGAGMHAFIIGLLVITLLMALGANTGGCFNPARDLGPRLAAMALGYPTSIFDAGNAWWIWGGWGATIMGSLTGAGVYDACIFKGSESPINYSPRKWQEEGRKAEIGMFSMFRQKTRAEDLGARLEKGEV